MGDTPRLPDGAAEQHAADLRLCAELDRSGAGRGVLIIGPEHCQAARRRRGKIYTPHAPPALPLADCSQAMCHCRYAPAMK